MNRRKVGMLILVSIFMFSALSSTASACRFGWWWKWDFTPPVVTIIGPSDGDSVSGLVNISFSAEDESRIIRRFILIDGKIRSHSTSYLWNTSFDMDGEHDITCLAMDRYWNWGWDTIEVIVSNTVPNYPPIVNIATPSDGSVVSETSNIAITVSDEEYLIPDIYIDGEFVASALNYSWDTAGYSNDVHSIHVEAIDSDSLVGSDNISVIVDNALGTPGAIKVMSYNIEASGTNPDWIQVVKEENPDILVLIETGTWDDNGNYTLNHVVNELNAYFLDELPYSGFCAQDITYSTSGAAILSRAPVITFNQIPIVPLDDGTDYDVTHDFVEAVVSIDGVDVHILGSHLKAMSGAENEYRRERETEGIINYMDALGNVPIMYMGDLNSFSPDDTGDLAPVGDLGYGPMTMKLYPNDTVYGEYSSTVHSFIDVFRTLNPTDPGYTYGHQDTQYLSRIDFIVVNSFFEDRLINSTCGDTATANTGSDHYCVDVFIVLNTTFIPDTVPPIQVTGLNATVISMSQIDLSWNTNPETDISHYRVYRDNVLIAQVLGTSFSDVGLTPLTTYTYEVSAVDTSINEGLNSEPVSATTEDGGNPDLVIINEFLPDPNTLYTEEWVEFYNPQHLAADLSGYILDDITTGGTNPYSIPAGTVVPAYGFLVLYQGATGVGLNNAGDTVNLLKPDGVTVIDSYTYSSSSDDVSYGRESDGSSTWITFDVPTPGASNTVIMPNGDSVLINEFLPDPNTLYTEEWIELYNPTDKTVNVSGYVLDDITTGGTNPFVIPMSTYIPAFGFLVLTQTNTSIGLNNAGDTVNYLAPDGVTLLDSYTYTSSSDDVSYGRETDGSTIWTTFDTPTPGESNTGSSNNADSILINEFLPDPNTLYSEEWIELYNPLDVDVDISGYIIDDITTGGTAPYTIPASTIISAHGFYLLFQSNTSIALNNAGDTVNYIKPDGTTILDSYTYSSSADDISYGRETDGSSVWITFDSPTPGASNAGAMPNGDAVLINEFLPDPNTLYSVEWIELYNPLDETVDISGYILDDIISGGTGPFTIPVGTTIPAHGFVVFYQNVTGIALNNAGDTVNYLMPDGITILDSYTYSSSADDISYGRETDGSSTWVTFDTPTPGASNIGTIANGDLVLINEFLPDPNTLYAEEWIELYNPLDVDVDISGYILDDITTGGTSPYKIPDGTIIPAHGFIVFTQSNTSIALNNAGDTVNYINPDGVTVLDSYTYTSSSDDVSYGREMDCGSVWVTFSSPTPGSANEGASGTMSIGLTHVLFKRIDSEHIIHSEHPDIFTEELRNFVEEFNLR